MQQYIDFFKTYRDTIDSMSAPALNKLRDEAFDVVSHAVWPRLGDENYEITDLSKIFGADYGINAKRVQFPPESAEAFRCDVHNLSSWIYYVLNDSFIAPRKAAILPEGVIICSLHDAAVQYPELVEKYYGKIADIKKPEIALNTLLVQDGVFIYVPKNVMLEKPIQIVNILNSAYPFMATRRILVVMDKGSKGQLLLCDHSQDKNIDYLSSQVIEVFMDNDSMLDIYDIEESSAKTKRVSSLFAKQSKGSNLLTNGMTLINGVTRNNYNVQLDGEHTETHLYGMGVGNDDQHIDNNTFVSHNSPHCKSNELFKYVLDDESKGAFRGLVLVKEGADKTEAYQSNKNVLASDSARIYTKPQLEIYADDVKCSHGATVGQLDQKALFYMRTRGISESDARTLLMQAFMSDVLDTVRLEVLRERLRHLVENRFYGTIALCNECGSNCHE